MLSGRQVEADFRAIDPPQRAAELVHLDRFLPGWISRGSVTALVPKRSPSCGWVRAFMRCRPSLYASRGYMTASPEPSGRGQYGSWAVRGAAAAVVRASLRSGVGERTASVLGGLAWNLPAAAVSRVLGGVAALIAARTLGPEAFGEANLALAASLWLQIPLFLGLPAALMQEIPRRNGPDRQHWEATALALLALSAAGTLAAGFAFRDLLAHLHGIPKRALVLALVWCAGHVLYVAATTLASARERFRLRALLEIVFSGILLVLVAGLALTGRLAAEGYVLTLAIAFGLAGSAGLLTGPLPRPRPTGFAERARTLLGYGLLATAGAAAGALLHSTGRLVANRYLDLASVGVLSVYQGGSVSLSLYLLGFVVQVFFPVASRTPDRKTLFSKLLRILPGIAALGTVGYGALLLLYLALLGGRYGSDPAAVWSFAAAAGLSSAHGLLVWFFASGGPRGLLAANLVNGFVGVAHVALAILWIPLFGIRGAGAAMAAAYSMGLAAAVSPPLRRLGW